jgi:hypothetical protein
MNANAMTAFASNVAVAALNSEGETTQERAMKALVNKIKWQKRERRIIRSAKTTVKRTPHGIKIVKRNNTKNVNLKRNGNESRTDVRGYSTTNLAPRSENKERLYRK